MEELTPFLYSPPSKIPHSCKITPILVYIGLT